LTAPVPHHPNHPHPQPKVLILTPSIIPSLRPAFHAPESSIVSGLDSFTASLRGELAPLSIPVTQLRLGTFDCSSLAPRTQLQSLRPQKTGHDSWPENTESLYANNFSALSSGELRAARGCGQAGSIGKGSPLRELHNAVFDIIASKRPGNVWHTGRGSHLYGFVGNWVPATLVGWMMGMRTVDRREPPRAAKPVPEEEKSGSDSEYVNVNNRD
jgi:hypothetical protein